MGDVAVLVRLGLDAQVALDARDWIDDDAFCAHSGCNPG